MKRTITLPSAVLLVLLVLSRSIAAPIPYPAALDAAAITQDRLDDISKHGLVLGNGDLNALLWERNGTLCLRVAKNDIWDARVDTSEDVPLMKVNVPNNKWSGGGRQPSWKKPYPRPHCAAVIRVGEKSGWSCIRSSGRVNQWLRREAAGIMGVEGKAGDSAGYRWNLDSPAAAPFTAITLRLAGMPDARFYVNICGDTRKPLVTTGWRDAPQRDEEITIPIPGGGAVTAVELYVMTTTGERVEIQVKRIAFEGGGQSLMAPLGMPDPVIRSAKLDVRHAVATAGSTTVRALADRNVFLIETDEDVFLEEIESKVLPAAELGETGGVKWLHMKMPGDPDYAGMEYALAVAGDGRRKAVAVVTSFDTKEDVCAAAMRLAGATLAMDPVQRHEEEWGRYWSASGVQLEDPDFELWWYRMVYYLRCFLKPGVMPAGLLAGLATDSPPWHGDYHHNYNAWQLYWTPFIINHPDLAEPWIRYMHDMLPRFRWLAKTTYECDGACVGISSFAFEPDPAGCTSVNRRQITISPYGYTLGMAGMSAQVLWFSHLYRPDRQYLDTTIYPVLREVALFYASVAEKCPRDATGKAQFGPSYSPEHGTFGVTNVPFDLAYARTSLTAAITAATELDCDRELVARFQQALDLLPAYPTAPDEAGRPVVVDWSGCTFREIKRHNITVPVVPVFPAEQVTWFSPEPQKELFRHTIRQTRHSGCNSTVMMSVAKARFSMPEARDDLRTYYKPEVQPNGMFHWPMHGYYLSESVGIAAAISEFLLQSVENTIRVFPCWPKDKDASFTNLRARGGFLVSAELKDGQIVKLEFTSTVGGTLRFLDPWTGAIVEQTTSPNQAIRLNR